MATATFTHDATCNASSATATVDTNPPPTVTTPITTLCPELSVIKTNNAGGSLPLSTGTWNWEVFVRNTGNGPAPFADGQTILTASLPSNHISYGSPTVGPATLRPNLSCNITNNVLTCAASGGAWTLPSPTGNLSITFAATATAAGTYVNPTGGSCMADPNNNNGESNETNH